MRRFLFFVLALGIVFSAAPAHAQPVEKLARQLLKKLPKEKHLTLAVLAFPYAGSMTSSGSSIMQERLTTALAQEDGVTVIERSRLAALLDEKKLEINGILDPATTKELGKVLGADALVTGTLNDLSEKSTEINARVIDTATGKILSAASAKVDRTWPDSPSKSASPYWQQPKSTDTAQQIGGSGKFLGKPVVQIAILLDTSNSMDGLINQVRTKLWKIVSEFTSAERKGSAPEIQVALYEYGNDGLDREKGYIRQVVPFTTKLDEISSQLFSLRTNGGSEYCGWVMKDALEHLGWLDYDDVYKAVFIAGNEPFTQGPVDFRPQAQALAQKGIFVNTIFCGNKQEGIATQWKTAADLSGGDYSNIDQDAQQVYITAPQDSEIQRLNSQLQSSAIPYGEAGSVSVKTRSETMKLESRSAPAAAKGISFNRSLYESSMSGAAAASSWDAASAVETGKMKASDLEVGKLPAELQKLSPAERKEYLDKKVSERKVLRQKINALQQERKQYMEEQAKQQDPETGSFDSAVISAIRKQAVKRGFAFK